MAGERMLRFMIHVRGMKQCLGRNTADVEAGPAEGAALLDAGGLEPELGRLDGRHVAAGATADDDDVVVVGSPGGEAPGEGGQGAGVSERRRGGAGEQVRRLPPRDTRHRHLLAGREGSAGDRSPESEIVGRIGRSRSRGRRRRRSSDGREREREK